MAVSGRLGTVAHQGQVVGWTDVSRDRMGVIVVLSVLLPAGLLLCVWALVSHARVVAADIGVPTGLCTIWVLALSASVLTVPFAVLVAVTGSAIIGLVAAGCLLVPLPLILVSLRVWPSQHAAV